MRTERMGRDTIKVQNTKPHKRKSERAMLTNCNP